MVIKRFASPRVPLVAAMGFLTLQGAVLLGIRILMAEWADVIHPGIHFVTGLLGIGLYRRSQLLLIYGITFGIGYLMLGMLGALGLIDFQWFPLGVVDHVCHIVFSLTALLISAIGLQTQLRNHSIDSS